MTTAARGPGHTSQGSGQLRWVKSSQSFSNGNCVEVAGTPDGGVAMRNSRDPDGPVLRFTRAEWDAFLGGARNHEFDRIGGGAGGNRG